jgi:hypothetical protein
MYQWRGLGDASSLVSSIAAAITKMEGSGPNTIATRNNNPGNLTAGPGMIGTSGGFAVFPDLATGQAALDNQIQLNIDRGLNLQQFFAGEPGVYSGYAPSADNNNPLTYANFVGSQVGIDTTTPLSQLASGASADLSSAAADLSGDSTDDSDFFGGISTTALIAFAAAAVGLAWAVAA